MGLTKKEKKALKETKRLAKLAAEAEAAKQLKKDELKREVTAQALTKGNLDKTWRELMLKIKEPIFRQDVQVMWHVFERMYDKKDHLIKHLMQLMDIADDQFQRTIASFCVTIDTTVDKFLEDMQKLSTENDVKTANLIKLGQNETDHIIFDHTVAETHLQLMIYHGHTTADATAWTTRGENLVKEDEDRIKYGYERENLRSYLEDNYNNIWEEYKAVLKSYIVDTADNQKRVRRLRRKDNLMADIIAAQGKRIANNGGMLKRLRTELGAYESGTKQAVFRDRRNRHRAACHKLKRRMVNGCALDMNRLALLVSASDSTIEWLENAVKKGEKILRIAALCRKFECQREKILPFGSYKPHSPTATHLNFSKSDDSLVANAFTSTTGLTGLWQRIAKAELTRRALHREKLLLEQENSYIARKIQEFRDGKIGPLSQKCICKDPGMKGPTNPPIAMEGVLEVRKYK